MTILGSYEPGTVAVATVRGVPNVRVMRIQNDDTDFVWVGGLRAGGNVGYFDEEVTVDRVLVVLDFGPGRTPASAASEYVHEIAGRFARKSDERKFFDWLAGAIDSQARQPRMDEPLRIGSVVKASQVGEIEGSDRLWTRFRNGLGEVWIDGLQHVRRWDDLANPRIYPDET